MSKLQFRCRGFILLTKTKEAIFMGYSSTTSSWKPYRLLILDLIFMIRDMCINFILDPLTKFTSSSSSSRSINFTDILPWNISLMITKIASINRIIITICTTKKEQPFWIWGKASKNWAKKLDHNFLLKRKPEELSNKNWAQTWGHWSTDGKEIKNQTK